MLKFKHCFLLIYFVLVFEVLLVFAFEALDSFFSTVFSAVVFEDFFVLVIEALDSLTFDDFVSVFGFDVLALGLVVLSSFGKSFLTSFKTIAVRAGR